MSDEPNAERWLAELDAERSKFTRADEWTMRQLMRKLIECGEYPTEWNGKTLDVWFMVEGYGAFWHRFSEPLHCPHCSADLCDRVNGPPGKREIGMYSDRQDRVLSWRCPDCGKEWERL